VDEHDEEDIQNLNVRVKLRLLNALLDGWVSDEDLDAFQIICGAVTTHQEGIYLKVSSTSAAQSSATSGNAPVCGRS